MKIAHLTTVDLSLRYLLMAQLSASVAKGDEVLGISAVGPHVSYLEQHGVRHIPLAGSTRSMNIRGDWKAAVSLWRILRRERPDVLHTHNPKPGIYGRVVGRLAGVPTVIHTTHGLYAAADDPALKRLVVYALEAFASRWSHLELVQNPEDLALMRRLRIVRTSKLRLLGNGVDLTRFVVPTADQRRQQRTELGFNEDDVVIGVVARLVGEKGIPELVEACLQLAPKFRLLLIGPTDPEKADAVDPSLLAAAVTAGAVVTGHRDDTEALYQAMDVFCLPSHREGFPRAAMEAAASGLPLVLTNIRGCRQVVDDEVNGYLVPLKDPASLAEVLGRYGDADLRATHGKASRGKAMAEFDEQRIVATVLACYRPEPSSIPASS